MSDFVIKRNDLAPSLRMVVTNPDGSPFDFTGYTLPRFNMTMSGASAPTASMAVAVIESVLGGVLRYDWQAGDTSVEGIYKVEFRLTNPAGKQRTFPSDGYGIVRIEEDLNDLSEACVCELVPNPGTPDRAILVYSSAAAAPVVQQDATIDADGKLYAVGADFSDDVAIAGSLALSGTVDGRDVSVDGAQLDSLAATVATLQTGDIALDNRLDVLEAADVTLDGRVDAHDTALAALQAADTALGAADVALDGRLDVVEATLPLKADQSALLAALAVAWISVPDCASCAALPITRGVAYVRSVRDFFLYRQDASGTVDNLTVLSALGGVGRWERLCLPHPTWAKQTDWGISPATGADENAGTTAQPLKTFAELRRRWGAEPVIDAVTVVTVLDEVPDTDPACIDITLGSAFVASTTAFLLRGGAPTVLATGTVTTWAALNRGTPAWNTMVATSFNFAPYVAGFGAGGGLEKQKVLRFTSGAASGYAAWIDSAPSLGSVVVSSLAQEQETLHTGTSLVGAPLLNPTPVPGDAWQIVEYIGIPNVQLNVRARPLVTGQTAGAAAFCVVQKLSIRKQLGQALGMPSYLGMALPAQAILGAERVDLRSTTYVVPSMNVFAYAVNCHFFGQNLDVSYLRVHAGRAGTPNAAQVGSIIVSSGEVTFDGDFMCCIKLLVGISHTGLPRAAAAARLCNVGFKVPAATDAITLGFNSYVRQNVGSYTTGLVYGTAGLYGIRVSANGQYIYTAGTKPTINAGLGVGRETIIGTADVLLSALPWVEDNLAAIVEG